MKKFLYKCWWWLRIVWCKAMYPLAGLRIRRKFKCGDKIRVLYFVTEETKWKVQSLYEVLKARGRYEQIVCVSRPDRYATDNQKKVLEEMDRMCLFFEKRGMPVRRVYNPITDESLKLTDLNPDIVVYQQAWSYVKRQMPPSVAFRALTLYIPYFTPNYGDLEMEAGKYLHQLVSLNVALDEDAVRKYTQYAAGHLYAGKFVGLGHPMLDEIRFDPNCGKSKNCIIYAPHWTLGRKGETGHLYYGTFAWNGREILQYAKMHPEMKWVFKPHPNLKMALVKVGLMTENEVEAYYNEWLRIGEVENGTYVDLFDRSSAMVTDCASFLTEYAATGKPIIHLISFENHQKASTESLQVLYDTYYKVNNLKELYSVFSEMLEKRNDYQQNERLNALRAANIIGNNSADSIVQYLETSVPTHLSKK